MHHAASGDGHLVGAGGALGGGLLGEEGGAPPSHACRRPVPRRAQGATGPGLSDITGLGIPNSTAVCTHLCTQL